VCAGEQYCSCVVIVVGVMAAVVHSGCCCTRQFHGTGGHPAAPAAAAHANFMVPAVILLHQPR